MIGIERAPFELFFQGFFLGHNTGRNRIDRLPGEHGANHKGQGQTEKHGQGIQTWSFHSRERFRFSGEREGKIRIKAAIAVVGRLRPCRWRRRGSQADSQHVFSAEKAGQDGQDQETER